MRGSCGFAGRELRHPRVAPPSLRARGALPAVGEGSAAGACLAGRSLAAVLPRVAAAPSLWAPGRFWRDGCQLVAGVPGRGAAAAARGEPGVAAGLAGPRAGAEAPRRRLAEVWPRQCEGFPPPPRRGRAGGGSRLLPAGLVPSSRGAENRTRRMAGGRGGKKKKEQKVSGSIGC